MIQKISQMTIYRIKFSKYGKQDQSLQPKGVNPSDPVSDKDLRIRISPADIRLLKSEVVNDTA
jgi:hypothetical protein